MEQTNSENYHKPYCPRCKAYVQPQVVSATHVSGGGGSVHGGYGGTTPITSRVTYKKMCPTCGEEVFSQADADSYGEHRKSSAETTILTLGILSLCCLSVLAAIPALIIAAKNKPLGKKAKIGVILSRISILLFVLYWVGRFLIKGH
jgi:ribosomal protein S27AE